jgi:hypothetical protein
MSTPRPGERAFLIMAGRDSTLGLLGVVTGALQQYDEASVREALSEGVRTALLGRAPDAVRMLREVWQEACK